MLEIVLPGLDSAPNVHPLIVHFPIALWPTALLLWTLALLRGPQEELWRAGRWLLYLGSLAALVAVATGLWAADQVGHDSRGHDLVHVHRNWMVVASALSLLVSAAAFATRTRATPILRWVLLGALLLTTGVSALGADRGALLVFGYRIGTSDEPALSAHEEEGSATGHSHEP